MGNKTDLISLLENGDGVNREPGGQQEQDYHRAPAARLAKSLAWWHLAALGSATERRVETGVDWEWEMAVPSGPRPLPARVAALLPRLRERAREQLAERRAKQGKRRRGGASGRKMPRSSVRLLYAGLRTTLHECLLGRRRKIQGYKRFFGPRLGPGLRPISARVYISKIRLI
jgi:hypothetical protein